jgi:hypothetical protein
LRVGVIPRVCGLYHVRLHVEKSRLAKRTGAVLCALGAVLAFGYDLLPVDLLTWGNPGVYLRAIPADAAGWNVWVGGALIVCGLVSLVLSRRNKRESDDAI